MPTIQNIKALAEKVTGFGRPQTVMPRKRKAHHYRFEDDGETPNSHLPLIIYRSPVSLSVAQDPAAVFEVLFESNGWKPDWRDGIYDYNHFHTGTHEVLGIARGHARVQFGGTRGKTIEVRAGDVVIHPAGVGHRRVSASKDLLVVGAYPAGGRYDEPQPFEVDHFKAAQSILSVPAPKADPVYGKKGPLVALWRTA